MFRQERLDSAPGEAPAAASAVALRASKGDAPSARPNPSDAAPARLEPVRQLPQRPAEPASKSDEPARPARRRGMRRALFALLPLALITGGYVYIAGGQVMSTDDAYVEADKVGVSTDVSGIVKEVDITENQQVAAGQVLYRLDDEQFRYAFDRADAQVGTVRDDINALKANYRDMQAQIKQAQDDVALL